MANKSFLPIFFFLSCLTLRFSAGEESINQYRCPQSFNCGTLGQIKFPFSNYTYSSCGLMVNCSESVPKIQLATELYEVKEFLNGEAIKVSNKWLGNLISSKSCDLFSNLILPILDTTSISFTVSPNLTLFKCINSSHELDHYFSGKHSYTGCSGYTLYYTYPNLDQVSTPGSFPSNCFVIQLPAVPSIGHQSVSDLFSLLADEFSIGLHVSNECQRCHLSGGQCQQGTQKFQCIKQKEVAGRRLNLKLILGAAAVGIGGILVILMFCIIRKLAQSESMDFWQNKTESYRNVEAFLMDYGSLSPKRYTYSDIKKMTNSFRAKLGQGGYGCVFNGKLENGRLVAVKVLKGLKGSGEEFINEVATISRTSHVNIVTLLGFCFEGRNRALIYEFMPNGSLEKFIYDQNFLTHSQLGWEALYQIAIGIARGLEYLHRGCNIRILHFDIKPHNILLDEDFCPKISDFGLAKLCPQKESIISMSGTRGTAGYIAPEVFSRNFGGVSHKSDVYSYGMMILDMVGARNNIDLGGDGTSEIYFPDWIYMRLELDNEIGQHGITNEKENERARKMIIVGLWCIQTDPFSRPAMSRVVDLLEGSLESLQIPPRPFLSSPPRAPADSSTISSNATIGEMMSAVGNRGTDGWLDKDGPGPS